jgi:hypothetical protein
MNFSTADLTVLRIRCPKCRQHTEKLVTVLVHKETIPCFHCGATINLRTPTNQVLISETAASCARIGAMLINLHSEA